MWPYGHGEGRVDFIITIIILGGGGGGGELGQLGGGGGKLSCLGGGGSFPCAPPLDETLSIISPFCLQKYLLLTM